MFGKFLVHAWNWCAFEHLLTCQKKPPHWLRTCTMNLPNMKSSLCKAANSQQTKTHLSSRITPTCESEFFYKKSARSTIIVSTAIITNAWHSLSYLANHLARVYIHVRVSMNGGTDCQLQMNRLSLRNNRLPFKTSGKLPISLDESMEPTYLKSKRKEKHRKITTHINRLNLKTVGFWRIMP